MAFCWFLQCILHNIATIASPIAKRSFLEQERFEQIKVVSSGNGIVILCARGAEVGGVELMKNGIPAPEQRNFANPEKCLYLYLTVCISVSVEDETSYN